LCMPFSPCFVQAIMGFCSAKRPVARPGCMR
jgi:hypothetical protein